jgi:hypothetical protein
LIIRILNLPAPRSFSEVGFRISPACRRGRDFVLRYSNLKKRSPPPGESWVEGLSSCRMSRDCWRSCAMHHQTATTTIRRSTTATISALAHHLASLSRDQDSALTFRATPQRRESKTARSWSRPRWRSR